MAAKTNYGLVAYAKAQLGLPYWYGTFGQIGTEALYTSKKKQWPKFYKWEGTAYNNFLLPSTSKRVHDCVGLIKGYLWSETRYLDTQIQQCSGRVRKSDAGKFQGTWCSLNHA